MSLKSTTRICNGNKRTTSFLSSSSVLSMAWSSLLWHPSWSPEWGESSMSTKLLEDGLAATDVLQKRSESLISHITINNSNQDYYTDITTKRLLHTYHHNMITTHISPQQDYYTNGTTTWLLHTYHHNKITTLISPQLDYCTNITTTGLLHTYHHNS